MMVRHRPITANKLLALLPRDDQQQAEAYLQHVVLPEGTLLGQAGQTIDYVYFLTAGVGSVLATTPGGRQAEAGIFGSEGYIPASAVGGLDVNTYDCRVQIDAQGYRMGYDDFRRLMENNRNFFKIMIRAIEAFAVQLAYTAVSNAIHDVNERLARWLLMCHDRVGHNEIALTHDFISMMLAVRRPSVTTALHVLEGNGFIRAGRGLILIHNRRALEEFAYDAYGKPEAEYRRLMTDVF